METSNPLLSRQTDFSLFERTTDTMNLEGVVNKAGILLLLCLGAGAVAWTHPQMQMPFIYGGMFAGFILAMIGCFKPAASPFTAPLYAVCEGLALGAISQLLNLSYPGIMVNAMLLTIAVLAMMLGLYVTRIVRVTQGMVRGIIAATGAVFLVYMANMILRIFGVNLPFIHDSGPLGIGFSLVVVGIAAANLLVDFAVIEGNIRQRAPKYMEWYSAMALLVTLVWLYLQLLRLLTKLRGNR